MTPSEMPTSEEPIKPSSAGTIASDQGASYYKTQYEQLEAELADFQASSRELEAELERDIEAAEKRERQLQEKIESLGYEVEEWKVRTELCIPSLSFLNIQAHSSRTVDQIQAIKDRSKQRPDFSRERDHSTQRKQQDTAA